MNHMAVWYPFKRTPNQARLLKFRASSVIAVLKKARPWVANSQEGTASQTGNSTCFFGWGNIPNNLSLLAPGLEWAVPAVPIISHLHHWNSMSLLSAITFFWWRFCSCFRLQVLSTLSKAIVFDSWFFAINGLNNCICVTRPGSAVQASRTSNVSGSR